MIVASRWPATGVPPRAPQVGAHVTRRRWTAGRGAHPLPPWWRRPRRAQSPQALVPVYRKNKRYFATATVRITQSDGGGTVVHPVYFLGIPWSTFCLYTEQMSRS